MWRAGYNLQMFLEGLQRDLHKIYLQEEIWQKTLKVNLHARVTKDTQSPQSIEDYKTPAPSD